YIDARIDGLLNIFRQTGGETFVIVCSDHGTCYGEDGKYFHSFTGRFDEHLQGEGD
ncbi:hypothetical protein MJI47_27350, partial [Salmonella enterica subsp. enterica serovar Kentucky]|nr:hypothetical protein [Salmonella enterica subsp. enterica serovar Kentucky]